MLYLVAGVYELIGTNMFAIQLINASLGSATAIIVYHVAQTLFNNIRVARVAAVLIAFFPSLVLWSSQALKDGLIILALAVSILATLRLMEKITARYVVILILALMALLSLRFYIFYMMAASVAGSFIHRNEDVVGAEFHTPIRSGRSDWSRIYMVWRTSIRGSAV